MLARYFSRTDRGERSWHLFVCVAMVLPPACAFGQLSSGSAREIPSNEELGLASGTDIHNPAVPPLKTDLPVDFDKASGSPWTFAELRGIALRGNVELLAARERFDAACQKTTRGEVAAGTELDIRQEMRRAKVGLDAEQTRLERRLRVAYVVALVLQQREASTRQMLSSFKGACQDPEARSDHGTLSSKHALAPDRDQVEKMAELIDDARRRRTAAWRRLASLVGRPEAPIRRLAGRGQCDQSELIWDEVANEVVARNSSISLATAEVESSFHTFQAAVTVAARSAEVKAALNHALAALSVLHHREAEFLAKLMAATQRVADAEFDVYVFEQAILPNLQSQVELLRRRYDQGECDSAAMLLVHSLRLRAHDGHVASAREFIAALDELAGLASSDEGGRR